MEKYAYTRVSSKDQNEARQVASMMKKGIPKENIFVDKATGSNFERKQYNRLLKVLKQGDTLYIDSIDRLGRNYREIKKQWIFLTEHKKTFLKIISMPILDTDKKEPTLMEQFLKDIILLILAFTAEQEYINIKRRQAEGIAVAKEQGKQLGRPSSQEAMQILNIKKSALYRLADKLFREDFKEERSKEE